MSLIGVSEPVNGRREAKFVLHQIMPNPNVYQDNGVSWNRRYTEQNMHTVNGMSLTANFANDDRDMPTDHGLADIVNDVPIFDATMVGSFHDPHIETVEINGERIEALVATATIDEHRYPKFVDYLFTRKKASAEIVGSVEIVGPKKGSRIGYDGGWKPTGRVPQNYVYSGFTVLGPGVRPADNKALLLEAAQATKQEKEFDALKNKISALKNKGPAKKKLSAEQNSQKEELVMDEKMFEELTKKIDQFADVEAKVNEINALNSSVAEKEEQITELNAKLESAESSVAAKDAELAELNARIEELNGKLEEAAKRELVAELNAALVGFTEDQKSVAGEKIKAFEANPQKVEINQIVADIKFAIAEKVLAEQNRVAAEINSFQSRHNLGAIYGSIDYVEESVSEGSLF